jgi:hypothetical protein
VDAYERAYGTALDGSEAGGIPDGALNTCHNALDRHVDAGNRDRAALAYDSAYTASYAELCDEVARFAGARSPASACGQATGWCCTCRWCPEAVVAMLAAPPSPARPPRPKGLFKLPARVHKVARLAGDRCGSSNLRSQAMPPNGRSCRVTPDWPTVADRHWRGMWVSPAAQTKPHPSPACHGAVRQPLSGRPPLLPPPPSTSR